MGGFGKIINLYVLITPQDMIKIFLANHSKQTLGGGFTFIRNLKKSFKLIDTGNRFQFVDNPDECDIYFIAGSSMVKRDEVQGLKAKGKRVILRIDNIPRNSRNRNTGTTRLYDFAQMADWVIFQSKWAKNKIMPLINSDRDDISGEYNNNLYGHGGKKQFNESKSSIILNGVDTAIFNTEPGGMVKPEGVEKRFLISRINRDNNKRLEEALDMYSAEWVRNKNIDLMLIGNFSREIVQSYFDFYLGERWHLYSPTDDFVKLAWYYKSCDVLLYPSYSDACPNVVLEAMACGLDVWHKGHGGIPEIGAEGFDNSLVRMAREYEGVFNKLMGSFL